DSPAGIALDSNGNILVADTGNGRIEKFSPTGSFLSVIASKGSGYGQLAEPNGIAVDQSGNIYVAEAGNHRVQKLAADGTFIAEWKGPDPGFYGPRRIAIGPDNSVYVVDQGRTRIVKFSPDGQVLAVWGTKGSGDGQFDDHTSVAIDPTTNKVYVADPRNRRIQVFDAKGKFLTKWSVPEWGQPAGFEDLAIDSKMGRLYASSANMNAVLIFDLDGARIGTLTPNPPDRLEGPSAWAVAAHYRNLAWGDAWQPIGWLLSMFFLLCAFLPDPRGMATGFKSLIKPKTAFFLFWILFFVVSHLWNFRTAPWNGDALFDESGNDLGYLKSHVIGHPYQAAWFHGIISRETLFHYYVWGFLKLFGFNILSYEAALFVIWLTAFVFTLLLVDLFFGSYIVTSVTALIFNFLPFAFIYTFVGYRYPITVALAVASLYFLHLGFR